MLLIAPLSSSNKTETEYYFPQARLDRSVFGGKHATVVAVDNARDSRLGVFANAQASVRRTGLGERGVLLANGAKGSLYADEVVCGGGRQVRRKCSC